MDGAFLFTEIRPHLRVKGNESLWDLPEFSSRKESFLRNRVGEEEGEKE